MMLAEALEKIGQRRLHLERVAEAQDDPALLERAAGLTEALDILKGVDRRTNVPSRPGEVISLDELAKPQPVELLRSHEVAVMFDVTERTVINWVHQGRLPHRRTLGGHLRFVRSEILAALEERKP